MGGLLLALPPFCEKQPEGFEPEYDEA